MTGNNNRLWHVLILAAACLAVYFNGLNNEPVYDDREFVVDNAFLRSWKSLPDMMNPGKYFAGSKERGYWPAVTLAYFFSGQVWGGGVEGYHLTSLLFHLANTVLFYYLVYLLLGKKRTALLCALLFAVHPAHAESVAWIAGLTDVLCAFFFLLRRDPFQHLL